MADANAIIKRMVETGNVSMGSRTSKKMVLNSKPKLVILSSNCPDVEGKDIRHYARLAGIPVYTYRGTSLELGELCRKPFPISAMVVKSEGSAKITELVREAGK
jgi:large subunit ribosomal protein L30e